MDIKYLETLGLSKNESKVYFALIQLGSASVSQIATIANVHRVNIYDTLERLQDKGLVGSVIKSNKKFYESASPKALKKMLLEKENELKKVKQVLPELEGIYKSSKNRQEVHSYRGILGIKTIFKDILDSSPQEILDFGATKGYPKFLPVHMEIWHPKRIRLNIPMKIIVSAKTRDNIPKFDLLKYRYINQDFTNLSSTLVYSNKVAIIMWTTEPIAILIQSEELAHSYSSLFYSMWDSAKD